MSFIHNLCNKLGENNKPIYTVMAIACGKGTVRPILSITDKKEKPDARKYAALRELMTEFIGVPTTFAMGLIAESLAGLVAKKPAKGELPSMQYKNAKAVLSLLGICAAAGYFVPQFCNMGMPPIMKKLMPNYDPNGGTAAPADNSNKPASKTVVGKNPSSTGKLNVYPTSLSSTYFHTGMRV